MLAELSLDVIDGADREKVRRGELMSITPRDPGVQRLIDDDPKTKWLGGPGRNRFAVVRLAARMNLAETDQIRIRLNNSEKLGSFRLLATSADDHVAAFDRMSADGKDDRDFHLLVNHWPPQPSAASSPSEPSFPTELTRWACTSASTGLTTPHGASFPPPSKTRSC